MAFVNGVVTIGITPGLIVGARTLRDRVMIQNTSANLLYIGSSGVTVSNGLRLGNGSSLWLEMVGPIYGVASGSGSDVTYVEEY